MILWFTEKILGEFGISNADYLCVTALLTLWWSVWAFNPTLYSPTAHIQSEIQGSFSVVSGLKLNKSDSGNCGHLNIYRWRMKVQVPRLADGCTVIHFMWLTWWHTLWGFNGDCRLNFRGFCTTTRIHMKNVEPSRVQSISKYMRDDFICFLNLIYWLYFKYYSTLLYSYILHNFDNLFMP